MELRNTLRGKVEMNHDRLITFIITGHVTGRIKRKTKKKHNFDEDESPDLVTSPIKIVGKEDIVLFFFPKRPGTTSALLHQLMHPRRITRVLLAVESPGFTKGD
jgi:hypothetical protein